VRRLLVAVSVLGLCVGCSRPSERSFARTCPPCGEPTNEIHRFDGPRFPDFEPVVSTDPDVVTVFGYVRSQADAAPLRAVQIYMDGTPYGLLSNADGSYQIQVPDSLVTTLSLSIIGHVSERLDVSSGPRTRRVDVELRTCAVCLQF